MVPERPRVAARFCSGWSRPPASAGRRTRRAYDFSVDLRTIGQGYQVRRFAADGSNELLSRRRLTQYLDLDRVRHRAGALAR